MITYYLINPSDEYTFVAKSKEVAALAIAFLGSSYGAKDNENEDNNVPVMFFTDPEEWYKTEFGRKSEDGIDELWKDVAECLESFVLGGLRDREIYNTAINAIHGAEQLKEFLEKWYDKRTSANNIGEYVTYLAKKIRAKYQSM